MRAHVRGRKTLATISVVTAACLMTAACGGDDGGSGGDDDGAVTIWTSVDQTVMDGLQAAMDRKTEGTDLEVTFERVDSIDKLLKTRIASGEVPDIALVPQPGVVSSIVELGAAFPLDDVIDMEAAEESMVPGALDAGMVDDQLYGLLVSMNVKSLIFYPKKAFEEAGYETPESLDDLNALADQIKGDGGTPYCLYMESGDATGWLATDWFEDLIMRLGSPEEYDQWVTNEIKFDSELVREAAAYFENVAFTEGNVLGGRKAIVATPFNEAARPMFADGGPDCWLLKQGSFFTGPDFLPENVVADLDGELGVTGFPPAEAGGDNPVLGGGDLAILMNDSDSAKEAMALLAEADMGNEAAPASSFISPHTTFDVALYPSDTTRAIADVAYQSTAFRFDGSDAMPAEVGAGSFWKEMTAWINDQQDLDTTLTNIDNSWPQ